MKNDQSTFLRKPVLIALSVTGLDASAAFSRAVALRLPGASLLDTAAEFKKMLGLHTLAILTPEDKSPANLARLPKHMLAAAEKDLKAGKDVVLAANFSTADARKICEAAAEKAGAVLAGVIVPQAIKDMDLTTITVMAGKPDLKKDFAHRAFAYGRDWRVVIPGAATDQAVAFAQSRKSQVIAAPKLITTVS